jgi:hypothetical protein
MLLQTVNNKKRYSLDGNKFESLFVIIPSMKYLKDMDIHSIGDRYDILSTDDDISTIFDWIFDCESCVMLVEDKFIPKLKHIKNKFICFNSSGKTYLACEKEVNKELLIQLKLLSEK